MIIRRKQKSLSENQRQRRQNHSQFLLLRPLIMEIIMKETATMMITIKKSRIIHIAGKWVQLVLVWKIIITSPVITWKRLSKLLDRVRIHHARKNRLKNVGVSRKLTPKVSVWKIYINPLKIIRIIKTVQIHKSYNFWTCVGIPIKCVIVNPRSYPKVEMCKNKSTPIYPVTWNTRFLE